MSLHPRTTEIFPQFSDDLFSVVTVRITPNQPHLQQLHLCGTLYLTLSGVTRPLHQHLRSFTTNGALLPHEPSPVEGSGVVCTGSGTMDWMNYFSLFNC